MYAALQYKNNDVHREETNHTRPLGRWERHMLFANQDKRIVNLGLQGGGAHGAFTWGVLDYLLEDGRLRFEGVSGTSAGAMSAVILAHGLMQGGDRKSTRLNSSH